VKKYNFQTAFLCFVFTGILHADVKLPAILSDNMCLQSGKPLPIWGTAEPGEKITVSISGQTKETVADSTGKWSLLLDSLNASDVPGIMTVAGKNTVTIHNVVVGSVWLCSGQSNMEFGMKSLRDKEEITKASHPNLRLFLVKRTPLLDPATDVSVIDSSEDFSGKWVECTPESIVRGRWNGFSAVGYFFGREILGKTAHPVGLIESSWGGTQIIAWISHETLEKNESLRGWLKWIDGAKQGWPARIAKYQQDQAAFPELHSKWEQEVGPEYLKILAAWKEESKKPTFDKRQAPQPPKPEPKLEEPRISQNTPAVLFNGMIAPLIPYAIQGVIWYQGESDAYDSAGYHNRFLGMITDWRERWGGGDFPFLFVQLANYKQRKTDPSESSWAHLREAQASALKLPNTGMATSIDIGNGGDIHPGDKADVGLRLALLARKKVYGEYLVDSGPRYGSLAIQGSNAVVTFTNIGGGLVVGAPPSAFQSADPPASSKTTNTLNTPGEVRGFAIAGQDQLWKWAKATIQGDKVIVSSDLIPEPVAVRYAWADNPDCNLYNAEGLPAEPFRTDKWTTGQEVEKPAPSRHQQKVQAVRTGHYDLVLVGDSITQTLEGGGEWEPLKAVWAKYYAPRNALNLGYSGYRTEGILKNLQEGELDFQKSPKVFVLLIGTNDTDDQHYKSVHTAEEVFAGTKAIVDLIRQKHPSSMIIIKRPYPCGAVGDQTPFGRKYTRSLKMAEELKRAGELTKALADGKQACWIDVGDVFLKPDGKINPSLMPDLVHPNAAGATAAAKALEPLLSKLLGVKPILD